MLKFLQKSGYISIETIIVAGLMLALGTFAIDQLFFAGTEAVYQSVDQIRITSEMIVDGLADETPFDI